MSELRVTVADVRAAGHCINYGARRWCALHGIDFRRLVQEGIPAVELRHIDCAILARVLEAANGRQEEADNRL